MSDIPAYLQARNKSRIWAGAKRSKSWDCSGDVEMDTLVKYIETRNENCLLARELCVSTRDVMFYNISHSVSLWRLRSSSKE